MKQVKLLKEFKEGEFIMFEKADKPDVKWVGRVSFKIERHLAVSNFTRLDKPRKVSKSSTFNLEKWATRQEHWNLYKITKREFIKLLCISGF